MASLALLNDVGMTGIVQVSRTPGTSVLVVHGRCGVGEAPRHEIAGGLRGGAG